MYNNNNLRQPINNFNEFKFYSVTFKAKFYKIKYSGSNLKLRLEFMLLYFWKTKNVEQGAILQWLKRIWSNQLYNGRKICLKDTFVRNNVWQLKFIRKTSFLMFWLFLGGFYSGRLSQVVKLYFFSFWFSIFRKSEKDFFENCFTEN